MQNRLLGKFTYMQTGSPFLQLSRLTDVTRLIDHLARHKEFHRRSEPGLNRTLGPPASTPRWTTIVEEHPQFFENLGDNYPLALRARIRAPGRAPLNNEEIARLVADATRYAEDAHRTYRSG